MVCHRFVFVCLMVFSAVLNAQEPWADSDLPVRQGLLLWLDAGVQSAARQQRGLSRRPLVDDGPVDVWLDGSGHGHHLIQRQPEHRPVFQTANDHAWVRFDGQNDVLQASGVTATAETLTLLAVVAPHKNPGGYRAIFSAAAAGRNDYVTGINIDQSAKATSDFAQLNVEGAGFRGAMNLMAASVPLETFHQVEVIVHSDKVGVVVNGQLPGRQRSRTSELSLSLDEVVLGARVYSNSADPPLLSGFLDGDVAELLVFDRALRAEELTQLRAWLQKKHDGLNAAVRQRQPPTGHRLQVIKDPPPVQMLLPGFDVQELPVELPNINNVLYRRDGSLLAVAYNGDMYALTDQNGDGCEETVELFWENQGRLQAPVGVDLTPPDAAYGDGVFVASKGRCSLVVDTDGDGQADTERVVASGWEQLSHGVDALGVAVDPSDGSVFFGLGTAEFRDAYLLDAQGKAGYRLDSERGTIMRIAPTLDQREIVCTGIRFPVAMRFHENGDLFCTDQEGATWLPNGNPRDELLHIQRGRHYGFPPRHPQHLPDVIDEPSTSEYGPQHQSTCGLNFNFPVNGGPVFGPESWRGDALVTGYSRGKLYRTRLVSTAEGYVAQNQLLACLSLLTADVCVSPRGDLIVATHSGGPDWGSGPAGQGRLFRIVCTDRQQARPAAVWAAGSREVRVAFDHPLDESTLQSVADGGKLEQGRWLRAGDRFESLRPGYAVVAQQMASWRRDLDVQQVQVTPDRRTLILAVDRQRQRRHYGITLSRREQLQGKNALPQHSQMDLDYALHGVSVRLQGDESGNAWTGWWPHLNPQVARAMTEGSAEHEQCWQQLPGSAAWRLETQLDLTSMLRARTQPGAKLDFEYPPEQVTVEFRSAGRVHVTASAGEVIDVAAGVKRLLVADPQSLVAVEVEVTGLSKEVDRAFANGLSVVWWTAEDSRPRPMALERFVVPWHEQASDSETGDTTLAGQRPEELQGGSWGRGRRLFFGQKARCSTCHQIRGAGRTIGPDLSNLIHRDYASVYRDVTQPNFAINPDHLASTLVLADGRTLTGLVKTAGDQLVVTDRDGREHRIGLQDVEEQVPSSVSIMPEGLDRQLSEAELKDLLTFLLTQPPQMPDDLQGRPPLRTLQEVQRVLADAEPVPEAQVVRPLEILLVAGEKDHGPGEHDYPAWLQVWGDLLEAGAGVRVVRVMTWPTAEQLQSADVMVVYQHGTWNADRAGDVDRFLQRGGGLSLIHYAVDGRKQSADYAERIALAWQAGQSRYRHGPLEVLFEAAHPIVRNFHRLQLHDESYWNLRGSESSTTVLGRAVEDGQPQPLFWCHEHGGGRVFVSIPGHYSWTFDDPLFRILLLRGMAWTAGESVDRFNELVLPGTGVSRPVRTPITD